ncbi:MAG: hypothetical protein WB696_25725, partial [Chthoniobacterales bacterium]
LVLGKSRSTCSATVRRMPQLQHEVAIRRPHYQRTPISQSAMIANVWSLLAKSSRGDCTEWPCTFNPSRANVIDRDAFNLGRTVAATNQHQFRNPQWSPTYGRDWQLEPWRLHRMAGHL